MNRIQSLKSVHGNVDIARIDPNLAIFDCSEIITSIGIEVNIFLT